MWGGVSDSAARKAARQLPTNKITAHTAMPTMMPYLQVNRCFDGCKTLWVPINLACSADLATPRLEAMGSDQGCIFSLESSSHDKLVITMS